MYIMTYSNYTCIVMYDLKLKTKQNKTFNAQSGPYSLRATPVKIGLYILIDLTPHLPKLC